MISVRLDLGNAPSVLATMSDPSVVQRAVNAAAESYNDDIHDWLDEGRGFQTRTGVLEQSINWRPAGAGAAEVYANAEYAPFVEFGTQPHVIEPKPGRKALKIPIGGGGGYILRRSVNHPGSRPFPYFFADQAARGRRMEARALSVIAAHLAEANGGSRG